MDKKLIYIIVTVSLVATLGLTFFIFMKNRSESYFNIKILDTKGTVNVDRDGGSVAAYVDMKMRDKDYIKVSSDGFTRIDCDRSTYSHFEHDTEASFEANSDRKLTINLVKGEMVVELQRKLESDEELNICTPNTTMGIRGTVIAVKTEPTADGGVKTINYCLEGQAEVVTKGEETKSILAGEGWKVVTDAEGTVVMSEAARSEEFEFADIDVNSLKGADDSPMTLSTDDENNKRELPTDFTEVAIDGKNFPDMIFRMYIMDQIDTDKNLILSGEELAIDKLNVGTQGITDLRGIEFFRKLTFLNCASNSLTKLDLRNNSKLEDLYCGNNDIKDLDLTGCTELRHLSCYGNELLSLDLTNNSKIETLICNDNHLDGLDTSHLPNLSSLQCENNPLWTLDLSENRNITYVYCYNTLLTKLDISNNTYLDALYCHWNALKEIDVSHNPALKYLDLGQNQLTSIDLSHNPELVELSLYQNELTEIDVTHNPKLTVLRVDTNHITKIDVTKNPELEKLSFFDNKLTDIDISKNPKLTSLNCFYSEIKTIDARNNPELTDIMYDSGMTEIIK